MSLSHVCDAGCDCPVSIAAIAEIRRIADDYRAALFDAMPFVQRAVWCGSCALAPPASPCPLHAVRHPGNDFYQRLLDVLNQEKGNP